MAEIELSVLSRQCLYRRIETREELEHEVAAWFRGAGRAWCRDRLAIHEVGRPNQTPPAIPDNSIVANYLPYRERSRAE